MLKILLIESDHLMEEYIKGQLEANDCNVEIYPWISHRENRENKGLQERLEERLEKGIYHFVFSIDYDPSISLACSAYGTKYASWIYDNTAFANNVKNLGDYINYAFLSDYSLYQQLANQGCRSVYYLPLEVPNSIDNYGQYIKFMKTVLFKEGELEIFETILQLEMVRKSNGNRCWIREMNACAHDFDQVKENTADDIYELMRGEEKLVYRLKVQLINYLNALLKVKYTNILSEIMVWYRRQFTGELRTFCWEFNCLLIFLNISLEEMHATGELECPGILQYDGIGDMCHVYLQTVFYLRRMEYEIETGNEEEILSYFNQRKLTEIALEHIIREGRIYDKEKVRNRLLELKRRYQNE